MSSILATIIALLVCAVVLAPVGIAMAFPASARTIFLTYCGLMVGLVFFQTGMLRRGSLSRTDMVVPVAVEGADDPKCQQIKKVLLQSGLKFDSSTSRAAVEHLPILQSLPESARAVVLDCFDQAGGESTPAN